MNKKISLKIITYLFLTLVLVFALTPLIFTWFVSFKTKAELAQNVFGVPQVWQFGNFNRAWEQGHFGTYYKNSVIVVIPVVVMSIVLSLMTSYALVFFSLKSKKIILKLFMFGLAVPMEVVIIQLYYHMFSLHLLNTRTGLILAQIALSLPFGVFFMSANLNALPHAILESAEIEGADTWVILWKIIAPLIMPAIIACAVFFFIWTWNEFLLALVLISKENLRTLPVGMAYFQGKYVGDIPLMAMGATLMTVPVIIIYVLLQKYFISGILAGALKE